MKELEQYIQSYFGVEDSNLVTSISELFHETVIKKGDFLVKTGTLCNQLSFVKKGILRIYVNTSEKEVTQWISTKGYFVTDLASLIFNVASRWNIQALTEATLYTILRGDYNKLGEVVPQWHHLEKLFIARCFSTLEDRIFSHLALSAEERYQLFFETNKELFNQVPLHYIASMLGMTPETFSRIRRKTNL